MTPPKPMRIEELLELSALDAFGLLDDYESEYYTRSFHHAPAGVQDEILRIQAELVADETLLPGDMPPSDLRRKVLDAVARAIEEDAHELAPLASIGQRFAITTPGTPDKTRMTFSGQFWRAVALVMIGVSIVLAYFGAEAQKRAAEITDLVLLSNTSGQLEKLIGPTFLDYINNPNCDKLFFKNNKPGYDMFAVLCLDIDSEDSSAYFFLMGMEVIQEDPDTKSQTYNLQAVLKDNSRIQVDSFDDSRSIIGIRIDVLTTAMIAAVRWEITDATGTVILSTA